MASIIIHSSKAQTRLLDTLARIAASPAEILITGPSGVGKELYAAYAHSKSPRRDKPFVAVNCANLSGEMIENEIFGHAKGAFTGAVAAANGIAAAADGGTLFLDEIDTLPLTCQAKILRFAQLREYRRLGESYVRRSDVRLITASNADLLAMVRNGSFREDLYFRLRVLPIEIPPLAERPDDIPAFLEHFVAMYARDYGVEAVEFDAPALERLRTYPWPGNVRELENCVRYVTCLRLDRPVREDDLQLLDLPTAKPALSEPQPETSPDTALTDVPLREAKSMVIEGFERMYIDTALTETHGNVAEAARKSGKHRRSFFELMRRYGIKARGYRQK